MLFEIIIISLYAIGGVCFGLLHHETNENNSIFQCVKVGIFYPLIIAMEILGMD